MIEMFPEESNSITISAATVESGDPAVLIEALGTEVLLNEDETYVLVRHLMTNLEEARVSWFEKHHRFPKPRLQAVTER